MGLIRYVRPSYLVTANGADITPLISSRLIDMVLTDAVGMGSDLLEIRLSDADLLAPVQLPQTGAEISLSIGIDGIYQPMGLFVFDEVELSGWPGEMTIRARAAVYDNSKGGKSNLQTQKTRSWPAGTKLADMVKKIAGEHGLEPKVAQSLQSIGLPHIDQADESNINLLIRVAKKYDAIVKPVAGKLVLAKCGESKSVSGETLSPVVVTTANCTNYRMTISKRETAGMVVAYWHAVRTAKRKEVKVGKGEPVRRLRNNYPTEEMALAAARAELQRRERGEQTLALSVIGDPSIVAEAGLQVYGIRPDVDGDWLITRVTHTINALTGYVCDIEAEKPNKDSEVDVAINDH